VFADRLIGPPIGSVANGNGDGRGIGSHDPGRVGYGARSEARHGSRPKLYGSPAFYRCALQVVLNQWIAAATMIAMPIHIAATIVAKATFRSSTISFHRS
jgi:hypothetical protein